MAKDGICEAARNTMVAIADDIAVEETADELIHLIGLIMDSLKQDLDRRLVGLLQPHFEIHPMTYNDYMTENVQKAQTERRRRKLEGVLEKEFGDLYDPTYKMIPPSHLLNLLEDGNEAEMELMRVTSPSTIYNHITSPEVVQDTTATEVAYIVAKSPSIGAERLQCSERLAVLESGLRDLNILDKHRSSTGNYELYDIDKRLENGIEEDITADLTERGLIIPSAPHEAGAEAAEKGWDSFITAGKRTKTKKKKMPNRDNMW
ncbi:hypothetical protein LTR22_027618 [Elasticomyces elasticus]|nr:hypothetical protein LTR22_027618 [Elasticomyces elasticus]